MKGDSLSMVKCGIGVLPLINILKSEFTDITQAWYTDDSGALGTFANIKLYFYILKRFFPGSGYYPEPSKSIFIVHPKNIKAGKG